MNFNAFTIQLTQYISQNHPDKIEDKEFIESRGQQAATVFADCSRQGMNLEECSRQANKVLYAGLHFSPYRMIMDIIQTNCTHLPLTDEGRHSLAMTLLDICKPHISTYLTPENWDSFEGSYQYHRVRLQTKRMINQYLDDNGF